MKSLSIADVSALLSVSRTAARRTLEGRRHSKSSSPQSLRVTLGASSRTRGMSLIEIMVVITLIGLVAAAIGTAVITQLGEGQNDAARNQAYEIAKSMDIYRLQNGSYPSSSQGVGALVKPPKGKPIMDSMPLDPWGHEYSYAFPGSKNPQKFDVRSKGNDGIDGNEDDIGNWPK